MAAIFMAAALLSPLLILAAHGLTLTGMTEESTGYRYFYTLRMLYGQGERPWVLQGQLPGVTHIGIQLGLTLAGFSPTSLFPRIDLFDYTAAALPHLLAIPAFIWMAGALRSRTAAAAAAGVVVVASVPMGGGWGPDAWRGPMMDAKLVLPDYYTWVEPIALVAAGWFLRLHGNARQAAWPSDIRLGLFAGICLAVKLTYVVFALPLAVCLVLGVRPFWRSLLVLSSTAIIAVATWITITWVYYLGSLTAVVSNFTQLMSFAVNVRPPASAGELLMTVMRDASAVTELALLMPALLFVSILLFPRKSLSVGLLVGSVVSLYIAYRRFEPQTLIEVNGYFVAASIAWSAGVVGPALADRFDTGTRWWPAFARMALIGLTVVPWTLAAIQLWRGQSVLVPVFATADAGSRTLSQCRGARPGKTLFLTPENSLRLTTVDSAIFKGGTDVNRYYWGASEYVHGMFPDRSYLYGGTSPALTAAELGAYSKIVFAALPGERDEAVAQRIKDSFSISVSDFDCACQIDFGHRLVHVCYR